MTMYTPQIIEEYLWVIGRDIEHDHHIHQFSGVLLHTLPFPLPKVMTMDPLVLYIPNRV
jgi:hypothetical protein